MLGYGELPGMDTLKLLYPAGIGHSGNSTRKETEKGRRQDNRRRRTQIWKQNRKQTRKQRRKQNGKQNVYRT